MNRHDAGPSLPVSTGDDKSVIMIVVRLLLAVLVGYAALLVLAYVMQSRLVHLPHIPGRALVATPADVGLDFQSVHLHTADDVRIHGWFVPAENAPGTVLFFHGNAGNISHRLQSLEIFNALGVNTLIIDYRGYGESGGRPSEEGLYLDAEAAYRYLVEERFVPPEEIVVFGRSLGGAVAARIAAHHAVGGIVVESGFVSVPELGAELYPFLPVRWLSRLRYDTRTYLKATSATVLIIHSEDDDIIPYRHGLALYQSSGERASLLTIAGDHNTGFLDAGTLYTDALGRFLNRVLGS